MEKTGRFTRQERLRLSGDIRRVYKTGKKVGVEGAKLFVLENAGQFNRIAFTLPRSYGNAVERNRTKRLCRESYRHQRGNLKSGYDIVFLTYKGYDTFQERSGQFCQLCEKAGLLRV
ncbi:MAG: ribonuclease P protein component [Treponema sp.]|jgi:ribonuclease P protein component|nr:ribonuclease P protein component [Treponema sp.]